MRKLPAQWHQVLKIILLSPLCSESHFLHNPCTVFDLLTPQVQGMTQDAIEGTIQQGSSLAAWMHSIDSISAREEHIRAIDRGQRHYN
jgi:hypothetical protein